MSKIVAGIDGGGSHTRVMIADEAGQELAVAEGHGSAVKPGQAAASAATIAALVQEVMGKLDGTVARPNVLCVGVAGVGREEEREALLSELERLGVADEVVVQPDALIALVDAFGDGPGILMIAGTGSVAFGRGPTGTFARCGGWGSNCGDEGSGAWIGKRALSVVTAASDGREPETALVSAVLEALELPDVWDLIPWAAGATPADVAQLAPVVMRTAQGGDLRASSLLSLASEELVLHIRTLARQLFGDERASVPLALGGGLLGRGSLLRKRLLQRLKVAVPGAQIRDDDVLAVRGAVKTALKHLGATAA